MARKRTLRAAHPEQLELRILPTAKVSFNSRSGLLKITGDNADNDVSLDGLATAGSLEVFINNTFYDDFSGVKSLKIDLKRGNDKLRMAALDLSGNVNLKFGDGADILDVDTVTELGSGGNGPNHFGGPFVANLGSDAGDLIDFNGGTTIDGNATFTGVADVLLGGSGNSPVGEFGLDVVVRSNLQIKFSNFGDANNDAREFFALNLYVQGTTLLDASSRGETFMITTCRFDGDFAVLLDEGDDQLFIDFPVNQHNEFGAGAKFDGGAGTDTIYIGAENLFSGSPAIFPNFDVLMY